MISQTMYSRLPVRLALALAAVAFLAMAAAATAVAAPAPHQISALHCEDGYKAVTKVARKGGKTKILRGCQKKAATSTASPLSVPSVTQAASPATATVTPPVTSPAPEVPTTPAPEVPPTGAPEATAPEVQAAIGTGFKQNPLVPNEVTWHFSASATKTVTSNGVPKTETVPLPEGELAFFVDGQLDCEIHALGAISASACTVDLKQLGEHEVSTIFSSTTLSSTATRTDYVDKYPTSTNLQVSIEPTAPEYLEIGPNAYGFIQYGFEVGRLRINTTTTPGGYPSFHCEGQPNGCLEPEIPGLAAHHGSVSEPLYAQHRLNSATGREEWHVAFDAYNPALRESGDFWQFPEEAVGTQFFHAVSEPEPALYEPSSVTLPLNLNGGHYPFYREFKTGEAGPSIEAVEGTMKKVMTLGTYEKVTGLEGSLHLGGEFYGVAGEIEGCGYYVTVDGKTDNERRTASNGRVEIDGGFTEKTAVPAGLHTLELWVVRTPNAGPGKCALTRGWLEAYEHTR